MKKLINNNRLSFLMIISLIIGTIIGLIFKENARVLSPFGDLFINLLLVLIVPLIFLSITTAFGRIKEINRLKKILLNIIVVFFFASLISLFIGIIVTKIPLVNSINTNNITQNIDNNLTNNNERFNVLEKIITMSFVDDFSKLLSKENVIALIIISIITGIAIHLSKEKGNELLNFLDSSYEVLLNILKIIMYYAPFGLACYFASFIGHFGSTIAIGYLKVFIIYTLASLFIYFVIYSLYAYIAAGKDGVKIYWQNIIQPSVTAIATCSSAASIPVNTKCTMKMGISKDIASTTIPLGTSFHKDGSILGSVFKIMFLVYLFNQNIGLGKVVIIALFERL